MHLNFSIFLKIYLQVPDDKQNWAGTDVREHLKPIALDTVPLPHNVNEHQFRDFSTPEGSPDWKPAVSDVVIKPIPLDTVCHSFLRMLCFLLLSQFLGSKPFGSCPCIS
jgi:hypothetical protein